MHWFKCKSCKLKKCRKEIRHHVMKNHKELTYDKLTKTHTPISQLVEKIY